MANLEVSRPGNCEAKHWQADRLMKSGGWMGILPRCTATVPHSPAEWLHSKKLSQRHFQWFRPIPNHQASEVDRERKLTQSTPCWVVTALIGWSVDKLGQFAAQLTNCQLLAEWLVCWGWGNEVGGSFAICLLINQLDGLIVLCLLHFVCFLGTIQDFHFPSAPEILTTTYTWYAAKSNVPLWQMIRGG